MFSITFIGWQGWMVASESTHLLVDPLLGPTVGNGPPDTRLPLLAWPPRVFDPGACPPLDALVISHEHEDHFDIASLARIARTVPVIASARMSNAARTALREMGFVVRWLYPGEAARVGDVEMSFVTPDHVTSGSTDEWDTLGYLFRHAGGDGAFFSNVDVVFTPRMARIVAAEPTEVLLYEAMTLGIWDERMDLGQGEMHRPPALTAPRDPLVALRERSRVVPAPGETTTMRGGRVVACSDSPFLRIPPRGAWGEEPRKLPKGPITPARELTDAELVEIEAGLDRIAEHMYGGPVFRLLHSQSKEDVGARIPSLAWLLFTSDKENVVGWEYQPAACRFAALEEFDDAYVGQLACWAGDLLGLLRGEFDLRYVRSFAETWTLPDVEPSFFMKTTLLPFFHPLRQPERCLARYRRALAGEGAPELLFRARA